MILIILTLETLAVAFRTRTTLTTITTLRTLTIAALTTLRTWTTLTLYISLGLRDEHAVRELVLTSLRINLKQLHGNLVAFLQTSLFDGLQTLPVNL